MDKTLIRRRFAKAVGSYSIRADVQRQIAYHMVDAIGKYIPSGGRRNVLEMVVEQACLPVPFCIVLLPNACC